MFLGFYSLLNQNKIFEYRVQMARFNERCYNEVFIPCLYEFMNDKKINLEFFAKSLKIDLYSEKNREKFLHFLQSIAFENFFISNRNMIEEIQVGIEKHIGKMQKCFNIFSLTKDEIIQNNFICEFLDNFSKKLELLKNDEYTRRAKLEEEKLKREKDKKYDNPENNKNSEDTKKEEDSLIEELINELNEDEARKKAKSKKKNEKSKKKNEKRKIKRQEKKERKLKEEEEKLKEEEENMKREEKIKKLLNRRYFSCPPLDSDYQEIEFYEPKSRFASTEPLVLVEEELYDPFYIEQYKITKNLKTKQTQHKRNNSDSILNTKNNSIDSKEREHSI